MHLAEQLLFPILLKIMQTMYQTDNTLIKLDFKQQYFYQVNNPSLTFNTMALTTKATFKHSSPPKDTLFSNFIFTSRTSPSSIHRKSLTAAHLNKYQIFPAPNFYTLKAMATPKYLIHQDMCQVHSFIDLSRENVELIITIFLR